MRALMLKILFRMKEPSSWAGLAALMGGAAILKLDPTGWEVVFGAVAAVAGAIAMFVKDPGHEEDE